MADESAVTIHVRKGLKVNIVEGEHFGEDDRIPKDRDLVVSGPHKLKIAVTEIPATAPVGGKAALVLMCG